MALQFRSLLNDVGVSSRCVLLGGAFLDGEPRLLRDPVEWYGPCDAESARRALGWLDLQRRKRPVAGYLTYEAGALFEPVLHRLHSSPGIPLLRFGVYAEFSAGSGRVYTPSPFKVYGTRLGRSRSDYKRSVETVLAEIRSGNLYQANLSIDLEFRFEGDPRSLFVELYRSQSASYSCLVRDGDHWILSFSPELFLHWNQESLLMEPMKGTAPRGRFCREDGELRSRLESDSKSRAENLMIVDLVRNDLGRLARTGSVRVPELFRTQILRTLIQMTSRVEAEVPRDLSFSELLAATFPSGSVTGAPKIAAMKRIRELEQRPRGAYCGSLGYLDSEGGSLSVGIRTLTLEKLGEGNGTTGLYRGVLPIGSGIVADSDADAEWEECLLKARFLTERVPDFSLIETLLVDNRHVVSAEHLNRMRESAAYFQFPFDSREFHQCVTDALGRLNGDGPHRLRLSLDHEGKMSFQIDPLRPLSHPLRVAVARPPTSSTDPFYFHKTTHRPLYRRAQVAASERGLWDVIFCNERGEVTEGSISNLFVYNRGCWWTPPVECGLLPGVARTHYVKELGARVEPFGLSFLHQSDRLLLTNALRGAVEVELQSDSIDF